MFSANGCHARVEAVQVQHNPVGIGPTDIGPGMAPTKSGFDPSIRDVVDSFANSHCQMARPPFPR